MGDILERDCTAKCHCQSHAEQILSCVATATPSQIRSYSVSLCHNFSVITDELGRNLLHVASSCDKWEVVKWLLKYCNADVDIKDGESGWTALHRSFYYGQLASAQVLRNNGANLYIKDREGFTPLDILLKDRLPYIEYLPTYPSEVYVWGSNFNYTLGTGNLETCTSPEILEVFRKNSVNIKQVLINKFCSVFLSVEGKVFTCGIGRGGRLGHNSEETVLSPSCIGKFTCVEAAAGQDHLLLLIKGGQVLSCGSNIYHQLGHNPPLEKILSPKHLVLDYLKEKVVGVRAACFHSVIFTNKSVYTFGLNAGQIGHQKGSRTQILPRIVSSILSEKWCITHVEASDGATVCATSSGDVYVLHEYQCRKITSRQFDILKLSVIGGHLDSNMDVPKVKEGGGLELKIILLTKSGKVYLWRQNDPYLRRCVFSSIKQLIISDIHINNLSVGMITIENEAYVGNIMPFTGPKFASSPPSTIRARSTNKFKGVLNLDECTLIQVKRIAHIHRGTAITSDSKGRNFAVLQSSPKMGLVDIPTVSESEMEKDLLNLFLEASAEDTVHDTIIKVENKAFPAHQYILASHSDYFKNLFLHSRNKSCVTIKNMKWEALEQILKFIYSNSCDFLVSGYEVKWTIEENVKQKKASKFKKEETCVTYLREASKELGVHDLYDSLEHVKLKNGKIHLLKPKPLRPLSFSRQAFSNLSDITLTCLEGTVIQCHKCILIARLDYFRCMLNSCWSEGSTGGQLSFPIPASVMQAVLNYLYSERVPEIRGSENVEFLCQVICVSDQLFIKRLKQMGEMALAGLITLKNATDLLEVATFYSCAQLKASCLEFLCINLPAFVETRCFDTLSSEIIQELSSLYKRLVPSTRSRAMKPCFKSPSVEELILIEENFPIGEDCIIKRVKAKYPEGKSRRRSQRQKSCSESSEADIVLDMIVPELHDSKIDVDLTSLVEKIEIKSESCETPKNLGQWIRNLDQFPELNKMMQEEKKRSAGKHSNSQSFPRFTRKERKLSGSQRVHCEVPSSPPNRSSCPWGKNLQESPPSPSFWDAIASGDFKTSNEYQAVQSETVLKTRNAGVVQVGKNISMDNEAQNVVLSFKAILNAEEKKQRRAANAKVKPLHIISIEDQAIEDLLLLYKAANNPTEIVTVSRVLTEEIASPVWKRHA